MEYDVIRSSRKTIAVEIKNGKVLVRAPFLATDRQIKDLVEKDRDWIEAHLAKAQAQKAAAEAVPPLSLDEIRALANEAMVYIPMRAAYYAKLIGVKYKHITIRNQRTKWGSCSSQGNLNFNCLLMLAPPEVVDSIVVHELCHLKEMNHSDKFYAEVLRVYPNYWECHKWLKENGPSLMARMTGE